jgi:hypothetical protein
MGRRRWGPKLSLALSTDVARCMGGMGKAWGWGRKEALLSAERLKSADTVDGVPDAASD